MTDNRTDAEKISDLKQNIERREANELTTEDERARLAKLQSGQK